MKIVAVILSLLTVPLFGQSYTTSVSALFRWDHMDITATTTLNLASAGLSLPTGRSQGEEILDMEFPRLIKPLLLDLPVDSASRIGDLIDRHDLSMVDFDRLIEGAERGSSFLSADTLSISAVYTIRLFSIFPDLILHRTAQRAWEPLVKVPSTSYTGLIIIADGQLPIHGKRERSYILPCFFPKIWDSDMNLIYEKNMVSPEVAKKSGIVHYVSKKTVLDFLGFSQNQDITTLVGDKPLRIFAQAVFGRRPTDPIINKNDALLLLSSEENRKILEQGRVIIVPSDSILSLTF